MATKSSQPLLDTPKSKSSTSKALYVLLSLVAIVGSIGLVSIWAINGSSPSISLTAHVCDQAHDQPSCSAMVSEVAPAGLIDTTTVDLLQMVLHKSSLKIHETIDLVSNVNGRINNDNEQAALADCVELMDLSREMTPCFNFAQNMKVKDKLEAVANWINSI